jgi:UDP-glucose 4-epimerase
MSKKTSVLVTGANGLLGREVCNLLIQSGHLVFGIVHSLPQFPIEGVHYIAVDLETDWSLGILPEKVEVIIHLAQSAHFRDFPAKALSVFQVNIASTAKLLDYGVKVGLKSFIYASSGGVYGNGEHAFHENSAIVPPGQLGYYLGSKLAGEVLSQSYSSVFHVSVLRYFFIYGPNQKKGMLIPRLMDSIATQKPILIQGEKGIRINPIHVEDAAAATVSSFENQKSATYNISGQDTFSIKEIADRMGDFLGIQPVYQFVEGEARDLIGDNSAMKKDLHFPEKRLFDNLKQIKDLVENQDN